MLQVTNKGFLEFSQLKQLNKINSTCETVLWRCFFPFLLTMLTSSVVPKVVSYSTYMMYAFSTIFAVCMASKRNKIYNM